MRILFLNDNRAHPNWGAQATPHAIDAVFEETKPDWRRSWLSWDWLRSRHRKLRFPLPGLICEPARFGRVRLILAKLSHAQKYFPRVADDFDYFADRWMAGNGGPMADRFRDELDRSDVLVYNGENSVYRTTLEGRRALFLLWLSKTRRGKPTCIVNHTAHLTGVLPVMNAMVRKVFPVLDLVTCRETASFRLLRSFGIEKAELVPDVVFWLTEVPEATARIDAWLSAHELEAQRYLCMSASGLSVSRPRGERDGEYCRLVRRVQQRSGLRAVLLARDPHCQFLEEVGRRTGAVFFGAEHHFSDLWPLLRQSAALISGHFHYAIISSIGGCPYVPLSANNHKMAGLSELLQWQPAEPFDVTDLATCGDAIIARLMDLLRERSAFSGKLERRAIELREDVATLPAQCSTSGGELVMIRSSEWQEAT